VNDLDYIVDSWSVVTLREQCTQAVTLLEDYANSFLVCAVQLFDQADPFSGIKEQQKEQQEWR